MYMYMLSNLQSNCFYNQAVLHEDMSVINPYLAHNSNYKLLVNTRRNSVSYIIIPD